MKVVHQLTLKIIIPSVLILLQACQKNPSVPESDPMFQEKKRPPYNDLVLNKTKNNTEYQAVDANFANNYQDAQREFTKTNNERPRIAQEKTEDIQPLTIQKIRDDATTANITEENNMEPIEPIFQAKGMNHNQPDSQPAQLQQSTPAGTTLPVTMTGEIFEIQAGSYNSQAGAMNVVQQLEQHGINNVRIDNINSRYTIRLTGDQPFYTREDASQYMQKVIEKTQHYDIMVVKK